MTTLFNATDIEAAAKAIYALDHGMPTNFTWEEAKAGSKKGYLLDAQAALTAATASLEGRQAMRESRAVWERSFVYLVDDGIDHESYVNVAIIKLETEHE